MIVGHRQGFAYAGSLDEQVVAETLEEARDNAEFGTPDDAFLGLASPDGVEPADLDLWRDELVGLPGRRTRWRWPSSSSGGCGPATPASARWSRPTGATRPSSRRWRPAPASGASSARTSCYVSAYAIAGEGADTQTGGGYSVGRGAVGHRPRQGGRRRRRPGDPAARRPQAASRRLTVVLEPRITATLLSILAGTLNGESVLKGRSLFADRIGRGGLGRALDAGRRPDRPRRLRGGPLRRRGAGLPAHRADRRRRPAGVPVQHLRGPPGRDGLDRLGGAGRLQERARCRGPGPVGSSRARLGPGRDPGPGRRRPAGPVGLRGALAVSTHQRRLLGRGRGHDHPGRGAGRAGPGDHHRLDPPAHAPRSGRHRQRRRAAAVVGHRV